MQIAVDVLYKVLTHLGQRLASNRRRKYVDQVISGDIQDGSSTVFYKREGLKNQNEELTVRL